MTIIITINNMLFFLLPLLVLCDRLTFIDKHVTNYFSQVLINDTYTFDYVIDVTDITNVNNSNTYLFLQLTKISYNIWISNNRYNTSYLDMFGFCIDNCVGELVFNDSKIYYNYEYINTIHVPNQTIVVQDINFTFNKFETITNNPDIESKPKYGSGELIAIILGSICGAFLLSLCLCWYFYGEYRRNNDRNNDRNNVPNN